MAPSLSPAGDADARERQFEALFEREFPYVWTSLRRLGVPARDLEDVTHDVLLAVYKNLDRYDPERPPRPWLFAFALRFASDYRKLARNQREVLDDGHEAVFLGAPADEAVARGEERRLIARALDALPLERRAVFILYELDERPMNEVAESLEIPLHTAYSRLRVGRKEFTVALQRLERGTR